MTTLDTYLLMLLHIHARIFIDRRRVVHRMVAIVLSCQMTKRASAFGSSCGQDPRAARSNLANSEALLAAPSQLASRRLNLLGQNTYAGRIQPKDDLASFMETLSAEADLVLIGPNSPSQLVADTSTFPIPPSQPPLFFQPPTATEIGELHGHSRTSTGEIICTSIAPSVPLPITEKAGSSCPVHFCGIRLLVATTHTINCPLVHKMCFQL